MRRRGIGRGNLLLVMRGRKKENICKGRKEGIGKRGMSISKRCVCWGRKERRKEGRKEGKKEGRRGEREERMNKGNRK